MDFERLTQRERALAVGAVQALCEGSFIGDAELQTVSGFARWELENVLRQLEGGGKPDELAVRAIGQCLNNLTGYPHEMEREVGQLLGCSMKELEALTSKWFGRTGYFERMQ
jgi:hypothetical protein